MHDVSAAQAVATEILKRLRSRDVRKIEADISLGALRFHDTEQVRFWLREILSRELGRKIDVDLKVEKIEPRVKCGCGYAGKAEPDEGAEELAHHGVFEMKCPECGSDGCSIERGSELLLKKVRVS